jgi:hypothetical protein
MTDATGPLDAGDHLALLGAALGREIAHRRRRDVTVVARQRGGERLDFPMGIGGYSSRDQVGSGHGRENYRAFGGRQHKTIQNDSAYYKPLPVI